MKSSLNDGALIPSFDDIIKFYFDWNMIYTFPWVSDVRYTIVINCSLILFQQKFTFSWLINTSYIELSFQRTYQVSSRKDFALSNSLLEMGAPINMVIHSGINLLKYSIFKWKQRATLKEATLDDSEFHRGAQETLTYLCSTVYFCLACIKSICIVISVYLHIFLIKRVIYPHKFLNLTPFQRGSFLNCFAYL